MNDIAFKITKECCKKATIKGVDYFSIGKDYVLYSRYYSGGCYECAFKFRFDENYIITPTIRGPKFGWKYGEEKSWDIKDPKSFNQISKFIEKIFSIMQTDRHKLF